MRAATALLAVFPGAALAAGATHFEVQATFVPPAKQGADAAVAVLFTAKDPDLKINESPAPRLKLDPSQSVLSEKPSASAKAGEPAEASGSPRYLDISSPLRFPVAVGSGASKGTHLVKASLAYFYCSKREGWCRKGASELEIPVLVR